MKLFNQQNFADFSSMRLQVCIRLLYEKYMFTKTPLLLGYWRN